MIWRGSDWKGPCLFCCFTVNFQHKAWGSRNSAFCLSFCFYYYLNKQKNALSDWISIAVLWGAGEGPVCSPSDGWGTWGSEKLCWCSFTLGWVDRGSETFHSWFLLHGHWQHNRHLVMSLWFYYSKNYFWDFSKLDHFSMFTFFHLPTTTGMLNSCFRGNREVTRW